MKLGPYELDTIITGDARILAQKIPDESVDLIFTDPVYQNIDDYRWLAETAARILKPDSAALVWSANRNQHKAIMALCEHLEFERILTLFMSGVTVGNYIGKIFVKTTPCIWMKKGNGQPKHTIWDISIGISNKSKYGDFHEWGKDPLTCSRWIEAFTDAISIVFDPFTGGGTVPAVCKMLGRHYLAFEIDPKVAEDARRRVEQTQPPLLIPQPEQMAIEVMA